MIDWSLLRTIVDQSSGRTVVRQNICSNLAAPYRHLDELEPIFDMPIMSINLNLNREKKQAYKKSFFQSTIVGNILALCLVTI
jgi:hypothetical protein